MNRLDDPHAPLAELGLGEVADPGILGLLFPTGDDRIELTRQGLLCADGLLPAFFEEQHQGVRYT